MAIYIDRCPNCGSDKHDISVFAAYFDVYECSDCGENYCHKCHGSNGGRQCPRCGSKHKSAYGRVSKP